MRHCQKVQRGWGTRRLVQNFPAEVCNYCGEEYYAAADWAVVERLMVEGAPPARVTQIPVYALRA
jgi:hypothetical protein